MDRDTERFLEAVGTADWARYNRAGVAKAPKPRPGPPDPRLAQPAFGLRLARRRREMGLTQREMARKARTSDGSVRRAEGGARVEAGAALRLLEAAGGEP
jgi:DNA-binding XRE family transcriptional regulator